MTNIAACLSSVAMDWQTPPEFLALVERVGEGRISLDPCTTAANPTRARTFIHPPGGDGLTASWVHWAPGNSCLAFVNPPYGRALPAWIDKCLDEARQGCEIIALVPARPDTQWFQRVLPRADVALFWRGRIKFLNADPAAPSPNVMWSAKRGVWVPVESAAFPSAVFYFGQRVGSFERAFAGRGLICHSR